MPVGVRIDLQGATLEWYDQAVATAGYLPGGPIVSGALSHWVTKTDDGICIVEVWESQRALKDNAQQRSGEIRGGDRRSRWAAHIEFFDVYNYLPGRPARI